MTRNDAHELKSHVRRVNMPWRSLSITLFLFVAFPVSAQTSSSVPATTQNYNIEAQSLDQALMELGTISRIDILYENGVVDRKRSTAVSGASTVHAAISTMLQGTGLLHRFTSINAVLIFPLGRPPQPGSDAWEESESAPRLMLDVLRVTAAPIIGTPSRARFEPFGRAVQSEMNQRLQNDPRTSERPFRARLAVHVDGEGVIRRLVIARTTGDPRLDQHIRLVLDGMRVPATPPDGLPQPIWFDIAAR